jgi:pyruvate dehydrogenase E1 component alpha subunit
VPRDLSTAVDSNAVRATAYGIPGERVEDNDVDAVHEAARPMVARARAGEGPSLLEVHTLRLWGHFEGDAQGYRPDREKVHEDDPIPIYEKRLRDAGVLDDELVQQTAADATTKVEDAIEFAKASAVPDPSTATDYVFA